MPREKRVPIKKQPLVCPADCLDLSDPKVRAFLVTPDGDGEVPVWLPDVGAFSAKPLYTRPTDDAVRALLGGDMEMVFRTPRIRGYGMMWVCDLGRAAHTLNRRAGAVLRTDEGVYGPLVVLRAYKRALDGPRAH